MKSSPTLASAAVAGLLSAGLIGIPAAPAAAAPTTFTVTSTDLCGGAGTFEQVVKDANANPGDDTITFTSGLQLTGINCYRSALDMPSPMVVTESVTIIGNGAVVDGGQIYLDPSGNVNRPYECPTSGRLKKVARTAGFLAVGTFGTDNTGVTATVSGFELKNLTSIATVYTNAALVLADTTAHDIIDFNETCNRPLINAFAGADVTVRNSLIYDSPSPRATDPTGMITGQGGDLVLDRVKVGESTFPRVVSWTGGSVKIVSSQLLAGGGMYFNSATAMTTQVVNSVFWTRGHRESDRIYTNNGLTTFAASTLYWTEPKCDQLGGCSTPGMGLEVGPGGAVELRTSAVGANTSWAGAEPLLIGTNYTSDDTESWVQAVPPWNPTTVLPHLLMGNGLPDDGSSGGVWIDAVTPLPTGVLIDAIPNADDTNVLRSPIDNSVITLDVLGNPRTVLGKRDVGAVEIREAPHLTLVGVGDDTVSLGWNRPTTPAGRTINGYVIGYRVAGSAAPLVRVPVAGGSTLSATVPGLTNGTEYQLLVWATYDNATEGPDSNSVLGTPFGGVGTPTPSATPGEQQVSLFWTAPDLGGHTGPLSYYVVYRPVGTTTWFTGPGPIGARTTVITELVGGVAYEFGVFAASTDGAFSATGSTTATPTAPPPPPQAPSAPLNVTAVAGNGAAVVSWTPPASSGSLPITNYEVVAGPGGQTCRAVAPSTTCRVTGLTNGTTYTFTVRALNGAGWGPYSLASNAVTPSETVVTAIVITGSRGSGDNAGRVFVQGVSTGLVGRQVTPRVKLQGETDYETGTGVRTISADGTFAWQRRTGKKTYVYFTAGAGVRSNRVIIEGNG